MTQFITMTRAYTGNGIKENEEERERESTKKLIHTKHSRKD